MSNQNVTVRGSALCFMHDYHPWDCDDRPGGGYYTKPNNQGDHISVEIISFTWSEPLGAFVLVEMLTSKADEKGMVDWSQSIITIGSDEYDCYNQSSALVKERLGLFKPVLQAS
jgi:hypothetical protein